MVCTQCKAQVAKIGQFCPECGAKFKPQFDYRVWLIWGAVLGVLYTLMLVSMFG